MVKLIGPCMSLDARGQLGKTLIFAKNGKTNYSKSYAVPTNPKSTAQTLQRLFVRAITQQWASLTAPQQASWLPLAAERQTTPYHAYLWYNLQRWRQRLLPVPEPVTDVGVLVSNVNHPTATWNPPVYNLRALQDEPAEEPYVAAIAASLTDTTPSNITDIVTVTFNPEIDDIYRYFDSVWTPPSVGTWYFASIFGYASGNYSNWTYPS